MDGFELEVHNWTRPEGTIRIKQEHSGIKRVIIHVYQNHVELFECGDDGQVFVTHFLGVRTEDQKQDW